MNGEKLEPSRYVEILSGDRMRFGTSLREYVFIKEGEEE